MSAEGHARRRLRDALRRVGETSLSMATFADSAGFETLIPRQLDRHWWPVELRPELLRRHCLGGRAAQATTSIGIFSTMQVSPATRFSWRSSGLPRSTTSLVAASALNIVWSDNLSTASCSPALLCSRMTSGTSTRASGWRSSRGLWSYRMSCFDLRGQVLRPQGSGISKNDPKPIQRPFPALMNAGMSPSWPNRWAGS